MLLPWNLKRKQKVVLFLVAFFILCKLWMRWKKEMPYDMLQDMKSEKHRNSDDKSEVKDKNDESGSLISEEVEKDRTGETFTKSKSRKKLKLVPQKDRSQKNHTALKVL